MNLSTLVENVRDCTICADSLPLEPRPVIRIGPESKMMIIGQAPGIKVHKSGIPWNDPSGVQLRKWLNMSEEQFYNPEFTGIVPMGFCYPGKGKSGDLPPRPECAPKWHNPLFNMLKHVRLTLLIGKYAQEYYLGEHSYKNLTENVRHFEDFLPKYFVLPHPSPRNRLWLSRNPWFEERVIPQLQLRVHEILTGNQ